MMDPGMRIHAERRKKDLIARAFGMETVKMAHRRSGAAGAAPRPAHLLALAELERLERELPADRPGTEEFYARLADILRRYVLGRFGLSAATQTTEELLAAIDLTGGPVAARQQLIGEVLAQCDLVKFARQQPTPAAAPDNLHSARTFVEQTADPRAVGPTGAEAS